MRQLQLTAHYEAEEPSRLSWNGKPLSEVGFMVSVYVGFYYGDTSNINHTLSALNKTVSLQKSLLHGKDSYSNTRIFYYTTWVVVKIRVPFGSLL